VLPRSYAEVVSWTRAHPDVTRKSPPFGLMETIYAEEVRESTSEVVAEQWEEEPKGNGANTSTFLYCFRPDLLAGMSKAVSFST